jgi:hypothetical protein
MDVQPFSCTVRFVSFRPPSTRNKRYEVKKPLILSHDGREITPLFPGWLAIERQNLVTQTKFLAGGDEPS